MGQIPWGTQSNLLFDSSYFKPVGHFCHHHCNSTQASNIPEWALFPCLNSKRGCSSWKDTPHTTQLQPQLHEETHLYSNHFHILRTTDTPQNTFPRELRSCCRIILCWDQWTQTGLRDVPKPLAVQKGRKSHAETWGRPDTPLNLGGKQDPSQFLKKMLRKASQKRTEEKVNLTDCWKQHL